MSRKIKKPKTFIQKRIRSAKRMKSFFGALGRNRRRLGKVFNGVCEVAARVMEKKL
ncbi:MULTISPECIES: hypothetical protein [Blautia]|uniref:Uncharacterized protein n=2 Tax=Blautia TaxID=572511 RepID=A0ABQ0BSY3_9FIRM|nr:MULTISPECIES: hypothetical protein [Blautia]MCB6723654.1 hypothetical protein [Blautia marasmi]MCI5965689.1 hypothetical protein [Clostridia bacterium]MCQ4738196.1 hypothetical protein [Blautia hominis]MBC5672340.1 hypothetical protein [Blautia celeris]MCB4353077.1 hypothetical protein [Blautia sp. RD014232]